MAERDAGAQAVELAGPQVVVVGVAEVGLGGMGEIIELEVVVMVEKAEVRALSAGSSSGSVGMVEVVTPGYTSRVVPAAGPAQVAREEIQLPTCVQIVWSLRRTV